MTTHLRVLEDDWQLCVSDAHPGCEYWHNVRTGYHFWCRELPYDNSNKVAIVVPFRDLQSEQQRSKQLSAFVPAMSKFMMQRKVPFKIFIIEQSDDGKKFNRGKLLNVGFDLACREGYTIFVLHDVDLLPSDDLLPYYVTLPSAPVHIARVWRDRYAVNLDYFGGIVTFSKEQFETVNGYPNNFWGWGGEDDELYKRIKAVGFSVTAPTSGSIEDMESMNLEQKLGYLKSNSLLKCNNKRELLQEHQDTWQQNGINAFASGIPQFFIEEKSYLGDYCVKFTVELTDNGGHWSDKRSGIHDKQYD